jgi:DNA invertase Pin-like site-specific DNA recombinase
MRSGGSSASSPRTRTRSRGRSRSPVRLGLSEALDLVRVGRADGLLVARQDRIARDSLVAALVERDFEEAGGSVLYAEGTNGSGPAEKLARTVMHAVAEYDRSSLVARLAAARARKAAEGGCAGGRPPFGYMPTGGALAPNPAEAEVVSWIFDRAAEGYSVRQIASILTSRATAATMRSLGGAPDAALAARRSRDTVGIRSSDYVNSGKRKPR